MSEDYLFIGDVHSQDTPLKEALDYAFKENLTPVLLGDVFDSRCQHDGSLNVLHMLWELRDQVRWVQSNHQVSLLAYLNGELDPIPWECLKRTVNQLCPKYNNIVRNLLEDLPAGLILTSSSGREYRVAHAAYPANGNEHTMVHGPCYIYESEHYDRPAIQVVGHNHAVVPRLDWGILMLDGSCGDPGGYLVTYDTRKEKMIVCPTQTI